MKEIEVKAKVEDFNFLIEKLNKLGCKLSSPILQNDKIFIQNGLKFPPEFSKPVLRIRDSNGKFTMTIKKRIKNGLDKIEHEIIINNPKEAEEILKNMDFILAVEVNKKRRKCKYKDYEICLDEVEGLGNFIEVEKLSAEGDSLIIQEELFKFLESLGVKRENRVFEGYDVLIYGPVNKNKENSKNKKLILATTSPHRKRFFETLGLEFVCEGSNVDEKFDGRPKNPQELVMHLAKLKAEAVAKNHTYGIIVGFDSVAHFEGEILEKPKSKEEDYERLRRLSGKMHEFYTGIHMINLDNGKVLSDFVLTKTWFRELKDDEIERYLEQDSMFKTYALGYSPPEHYSASFVKRIEGSYNNLCWGLPVEKIMSMLFEIGYEI